MVQQILSSGGEPPVAPAIPSRILILYASQTGQAESISEFIYKQFVTGCLKPVVDCLEASNKDDNKDASVQRTCSSNFEEHKDFFELKNDPESSTSYQPYLLITVASTTGQGDPPDSSLKFYRYLKKLQRTTKGSKPFGHIQYALLGLGDTNYDNFAQYSKNLNRVFQELGAKTFVDSKYADDAGELETVTEPFIENLSDTLLNLYTGSCRNPEPQIDSKMESQDKTPSGLIPELEKLEISEKKAEEKVSESLRTFQKSAERLKYETSDSERVSEINRKFQSLRGPFPAGEDSEYRKMPASKIVAEKLEVLDDDKKLNSLLEFFQNRQKESVVYDAVAEIVEDEVLREPSPSSSLLQDKLTYKAKLTFPMTSEQIEAQRSFIPGDSYGIYCMNSLSDILTICNHSSFELSDREGEQNIFEFLLQEESSKRLGIKHQGENYELLSYLTYCVDSRTLVKRRDLFQLSQLATDAVEASALKEISTRKSNKLYDTVILPNMVTICDILRLFPSIQIDISVLIAMLNPAKPRYFSLSNIPEVSSDRQVGEVWVALKNDLPKFQERQDDGFLGQFSGKFFLPGNEISNQEIDQQLRKIFTSSPNFHCSSVAIPGGKIPVFAFLRPNTFSISMNFEIPALFLSAGTGLSPFLSYFKSRDIEKNKPEGKDSIFSRNVLFHGARSRDSIIESSCLTDCFDKDSLFLTFSRQKGELPPSDSLNKFHITNGRVPDSLQQNSEAILKLLECRVEADVPLNIYICGGKAFENDVKAKLKTICDEAKNVLPESFWSDKLVKCVHVDQW